MTPEERLEARRTLGTLQPTRTICNVIRRIYMRATDQEIGRLCEEAIWMAKRMDAKLRERNHTWDKGFWRDENSADS